MTTLPADVSLQLEVNHAIASLARCYYGERPGARDITTNRLANWAAKHDIASPRELALLDLFPSLAIRRDSYV